MTEPTSKMDPQECLDRGPQSALEKRFITAFLREKGYCLEDLEKLPRKEARRLMTEACQYACLKLTEIEAIAGFCRKIKTDHS
jgi:hypothetical protein